MILEADEPSDLLVYILSKGGTIDDQGILRLPETMGTGYLRLITPFPGLSLLVQDFELYEELLIKRLENKGPEGQALIFSFRNILPAKADSLSTKVGMSTWSSVQVSTSEMAMDIPVPAFNPIKNLIIGVNIEYLRKILAANAKHEFIELLLENGQPYLYEELISSSIQAAAATIFQADDTDSLAQFFYKLKAEELIYLFLSELLKREQLTFYPLNKEDIRQIYQVRDTLVQQVDTPPALEQLAKDAGMSVSKLGRLFRQVFGESVYHYYQKIRMQQAAYLLREQHLSVAEVGYQLGFTNLSHFSRLFEKHIGVKPKKYSKG